MFPRTESNVFCPECNRMLTEKIWEDGRLLVIHPTPLSKIRRRMLLKEENIAFDFPECSNNGKVFVVPTVELEYVEDSKYTDCA